MTWGIGVQLVLLIVAVDLLLAVLRWYVRRRYGHRIWWFCATNRWASRAVRFAGRGGGGWSR